MPCCRRSRNFGQVVKIRDLTFNGQTSGGGGAIEVRGSGTLIIENCVFENFANGTALREIDPSDGAVNLVIINSRISNNAAGVLIRPLVIGGGINMKPSVNATFDHVTVAQNSGGGIHTDSSDGPITVDIADSTISDNASNGFNVTSGTGPHNNMVNIIRTTIANNGLVGIQSGGSNAAVLLNATPSTAIRTARRMRSRARASSATATIRSSALPVPALPGRRRYDRQSAMARGEHSAGPAPPISAFVGLIVFLLKPSGKL